MADQSATGLGKRRDGRRLSVIIPACNEESCLGATLDRVRCGRRVEVIVVDGQSVDRTPSIARAGGARVISSPRGRGRQMNAGAGAASGDVLLFLHADTLLPVCYDRHVFEAVRRPGVVAGAFALRVDAPGRSLRLVEKTVGWRSRRWQMPYGDQALFLRAGTFRRLGGFPDVPAMEDYEFVRRLRRQGRIEIVSTPVVTSARRWLEGGVWRTTLLNQLCIAAYRLRLPVSWIAAWRGRRSRGEPARSTPLLLDGTCRVP